jgi:hypothetical protein
MYRSVWLKDGVSTFPVQQPMVGQREFYDAFKEYLQDLKSAPMARVFTLIAKWGIGKSRIAYELISEALGIDKGWTIRNQSGELQHVRLLQPDFADGILPIYIRYEQMHEDLLYGENWVGYGAYVALSRLAEQQPSRTIQGAIIKHIHDHFLPLGFSPAKLAEMIELEKHDADDLLQQVNQLDQLVQNGLSYLRQFGIEHLMVIVDEVESEYELFMDGIKEHSEERKKKVDGEAIKVITSAIKHEDSRTRHPNVSFLLLCSPAIGDQIKALEALARRLDKLEISQNSYADISDYIESLQQSRQLREYPAGLVEAAYTIAAGNFGWLNVIMAHCDQYLEQHPDRETGEILQDLAYSVPRFKESLIDHSQLDYIDTKPIHISFVKKALLRQLPYPKEGYSQEEQQILLSAKHIEGISLFNEFVALPLTKNDLGFYLVQNKYKVESDHLFVYETTGESFSLDVLLRSLETFSINAPKGTFIVGKDRETFLAQVRMLYPKDEVIDAAELLYTYLEQRMKTEQVETYIGPSFTFLERLNRRYAVKTGIANYLLNEEKDQQLQQHLEQLHKQYDKDGEIHRLLRGFARAIEQDYPDEKWLEIKKGEKCGLRINVTNHMYLGVHPKKNVDIVWASKVTSLHELVDSRLLDIGNHPIIILSSTADTEVDIENLKRKYERIGRCILFFQVTNFQKKILEALSVEREMMDIRRSAHQLAQPFRAKIRAITDEIAKVARAWFEANDQAGYVLRPIIFTKSEQDQLPLLAEGYKKMIIHDATVAELGAKQGVKFTDSEDFTRFRNVLKATKVPAKLEKDGYRGAGLFIQHADSDQYDVQIPNAFASLLSFIGNRRVALKEVESSFFFSSVDVMTPPKIVEQWVRFLQALKIVQIDENAHVENVVAHTLQGKRDKIKQWYENEYDKLVDEFKETIDQDRMNLLKRYKRHGNLEKIDEALQHIDVKMLHIHTHNQLTTWKEQLRYLEQFHEECDFIFNEEKWNNLPPNERNFATITFDRKDMPIWEKLKLVQQFHEYVSTIQKDILEKIQTKIEEMKNTNEYKSYYIPISTFTYVLELYHNEIVNAMNHVESSRQLTMVSNSETLAYHLSLANYKEAIDRLNTIISQVGLKKISHTTVEWKEKSGIAGRYQELKDKWMQMVDMFEEYKPQVEKWLAYYERADTDSRDEAGIEQLSSLYKELQLFLESGFEEAVDDIYTAKKEKPSTLLDETEKLLQEHKHDITDLIAQVTKVENTARKKRNEHFDELLIDAVNCIFRLERKSQYRAERNIAIQEDSYEQTIEKVTAEMKELETYGQQFFTKHAQFVRFEFFKDVVAHKGDLDWTNYQNEKRELEQIGLIRSKVEVL